MFWLQCFHPFQNPWLESVFGGDRRGDDQFAYHLWMLNSDLQSDPAANAIAEKVGLLNPKLRQQLDRILRHVRIRERTIAVRSVAMTLLLDGNDAPSSGKPRKQLGERGVDTRQPTMQEDQREAVAMRLVIHRQTVNLRVAALGTIVHRRALGHDHAS